MSTSDGSQPPERLLSKQELATYIGRTTRTIDNYVRRGMPYIPCGGGKRFHLPSVIAWLQAGGGPAGASQESSS
jgi:phage terminase Nu1 subunit (DNA packaging protein)